MSQKLLHTHQVVFKKLSPLQLIFQHNYQKTYFFKDNKLYIEIQAEWNSMKKQLMVYDNIVDTMNHLTTLVFPYDHPEAIILQKFKDKDAQFNMEELKIIINRYEEAYDDYMIKHMKSLSELINDTRVIEAYITASQYKKKGI